MTKAIIFDLDSCLAAADEVGEQLFAPAFAAIRAANDGSVPEETLRADSQTWRRGQTGEASESLWQLPQAATLIRTQPAAGWGISRSTISNARPGRVLCAARIF